VLKSRIFFNLGLDFLFPVIRSDLPVVSNLSHSPPAVVLAKARTHNHRRQLLKRSRRPANFNNIRRGVWVLAFARTTSGLTAPTAAPASRARARHIPIASPARRGTPAPI